MCYVAGGTLSENGTKSRDSMVPGKFEVVFSQLSILTLIDLINGFGALKALGLMHSIDYGHFQFLQVRTTKFTEHI